MSTRSIPSPHRASIMPFCDCVYRFPLVPSTYLNFPKSLYTHIDPSKDASKLSSQVIICIIRQHHCSPNAQVVLTFIQVDKFFLDLIHSLKDAVQFRLGGLEARVHTIRVFLVECEEALKSLQVVWIARIQLDKKKSSMSKESYIPLLVTWVH